MKEQCFIGIDNGVSGSLALLYAHKSTYHRDNFISMPTEKAQDYTKTKKNITRIHYPRLFNFLDRRIAECDCFAMLERPMVNPGRFRATASALRALEATIIVLENLGIGFVYVDSKEWQSKLLPYKAEGKELKWASRDIGCRLYPHFKERIEDHGDADGLLIAHYCWQTYKR